MIDSPAFRMALSKSSNDWQVDHLNELDSTNLELDRRYSDASDVPHLVLWTEIQTTGKGRLNRKWVSVPCKDITASLIFPSPVEPVDVPKINLCAGLAVVDVLKREYNLNSEARWPNDVLAFHGKICGILSSYLAEPNAVICGIGLNVNSLPDDIILDKYGNRTTLLAETGITASREELLASWILAFEKFWPLADIERVDILRDEFNKASFYKDRRLKVLPGSGPIRNETSDANGFEGIARSIDDSGNLIIELPDGDYYTVYIDDVLIPL